MTTLYFLVGVAGSGKSSWANATNLGEHVVLSTDNYIQKFADENGTFYNDVFKDLYKEAEFNLRSDLTKAIVEDKTIVWDQTNLTKKARSRKLSMIPKRYKKIAVFFDTSKEILDMTNVARKMIGKNLPEHVLNNMIETLEPPSKSEGYDEVIIIKRN